MTQKDRFERIAGLFYISDDGARIPLLKYLPEVLRQTGSDVSQKELIKRSEQLAFQELKQRNQFFSDVDSVEVQGSINEMIEQVDVGSIRLVHIPRGLDEKIDFCRANANFVTVYGSRERCFVASRELGNCVYVRGLDNSGKILDDQAKWNHDKSGRMVKIIHDYHIGLIGDSLDLPIGQDGKSMHPKVRKQIVALVFGSKLAEAIGKPYKKFSSNGIWAYDTMSPARLLDLSASDSQVICQIKEALYVHPKA